MQDLQLWEPWPKTKATQGEKIKPATVLKVPYHRDLETIGINKILSKNLVKYCGKYEDFNAVFGKNPPIITWTKAQTLGDILINSKQA